MVVGHPDFDGRKPRLGDFISDEPSGTLEYLRDQHAAEVANLKDKIRELQDELQAFMADREAEEREERLRELRKDFHASSPEKLTEQIKSLRGGDNIDPAVAILQVLADKLPADFNLVFFDALDLFEEIARREEKAKWVRRK